MVAARLSCRQIGEADLPCIAELLRAGFPHRTLSYWQDGLRRMAAYAPPEGMPRFGHLLASGDTPVGALLLISSTVANASAHAVRGNVSSWYVQPDFRAYAPMLASRATRNDAVTYVNVWPASHTVSTIQAQGFVKGAGGYFVGLPALGPPRRNIDIVWRQDEWGRSRFISAAQLRLMADHERFGCVCLWCETKDGGRPFIFRKRVSGSVRLPSAMLIYADSLDDFEDCAAPLGRFLARRGMPAILVGADRPLRNMPGRYFSQKMHIYYKGAHAPRGSDLSYTDAALFGI